MPNTPEIEALSFPGLGKRTGRSKVYRDVENPQKTSKIKPRVGRNDPRRLEDPFSLIESLDDEESPVSR